MVMLFIMAPIGVRAGIARIIPRSTTYILNSENVAKAALFLFYRSNA